MSSTTGSGLRVPWPCLRSMAPPVPGISRMLRRAAAQRKQPHKMKLATAPVESERRAQRLGASTHTRRSSRTGRSGRGAGRSGRNLQSEVIRAIVLKTSPYLPTWTAGCWISTVSLLRLEWLDVRAWHGPGQQLSAADSGDDRRNCARVRSAGCSGGDQGWFVGEERGARTCDEQTDAVRPGGGPVGLDLRLVSERPDQPPDRELRLV